MTRKYNIDFLRIMASFMVVFLHVSADKWYSVPYTSYEWMVFNLYDTAVRSAVPLFFMMSGMLMYSRENISLKKLFGKNILRLVILYFLFSLLYAVDKFGIDYMFHYFNGREFFDAVMESKYHLWFLPSLVSVYVGLPLIYPLKEKENLLNYLVLFFLVFGIGLHSLKMFTATEDIAALLGKFDYLFAYYFGYFVLGYVISINYRRIKISSLWLVVILAGVIVLTAAGNYLLCVAKQARVSSLYSNFFVSTFIEACIIFILFLRIPTKRMGRKAAGLSLRLSGCTLFVYLFHPFVIEHLGIWFGLDTLSVNPILSVPIIAVIVFTICIFMGLIVTGIPIVKKLFS